MRTRLVRATELTVPTRQLQTGGGGADAYSGMLDCFKKIIKNEGFVPAPPSLNF